MLDSALACAFDATGGASSEEKHTVCAPSFELPLHERVFHLEEKLLLLEKVLDAHQPDVVKRER